MHYISYKEYDHRPQLRLLIALGADPLALDMDKRTPLHIACDKDNVWAVDLLVLAGSVPSLKDRNGQSPMDLAKSDFIKK